MTQNQINFAKLKEEQRHNQITEGQAGQQLGINWYSAQEQGRHNVASEGINWYSAQRQADYWGQLGAKAESEARLTDIKAQLEPLRFGIEQLLADVKQMEAGTNRAAVTTQAKRVNAEIAKWEREYGLDLEKWTSGERAKIISEIVRNYVSSAESATEAADKVIKIIQGFLNKKEPKSTSRYLGEWTGTFDPLDLVIPGASNFK